MPRWYVGRESGKRPWEECYRGLLRAIEHLDVARLVHVIRRSKPAGKDYWLFIAVEAATANEAKQFGRDIFETASRIAGIGFGQIFESDPTTREGFLVPTEFPTDGRIPPEPPSEDEDRSGPFVLEDISPPLTKLEVQINPACDKLVDWMSGIGEGSWESFLRVCRMLGAAETVQAARRLFRRLLILGHIECSSDGRSWCIAPPVVVQLAADPTRVVWCGSRCDELVSQIPSTWTRLPLSGQPAGSGPSVWSLSVPAEVLGANDLPQCGNPPRWDAVTWGGPVAEHLASLLPTLNEWVRMLGPVDRPTTPETAEQFDLRTGEYIEQPKFRVFEGGTCAGPAGLYRLGYGKPPRRFELTAYFEPTAPPARQFLRGDWYGLRFLALSRSGKYTKAIWRPEDGGTLAIPARQRWPLLFERVLILASGTLPERTPDSPLLCYHGVPLHLAVAVAKPLNVTIETN
jgi:hypothetical protein